MAKAPGSKLTLHLEGSQITHDRFIKAVESFFGLLKEVTAEVAGSPKAVKWIVTVKGGSIDLGVVPKAAVRDAPAERVAVLAFDGMRQLQTTGKRPHYFNDDALQEARDLFALSDGYSIKAVQLRQSRKRFRLRDDVVASVDALLGGKLTEIGTIEGTIQMISTRGSLRVGVWDSLNDQPIRCFIRPDMLDEAKAALGKRVAVSGIIRLRSTGEATSIEVQSIDIFPSDELLPDPEEVFGILTSVG